MQKSARNAKARGRRQRREHRDIQNRAHFTKVCHNCARIVAYSRRFVNTQARLKSARFCQNFKIAKWNNRADFRSCCAFTTAQNCDIIGENKIHEKTNGTGLE